MTRIGVDLEQYLIDPQSSGIQRVLQHLARQWPKDLAQADFVLPYGSDYLCLSPELADAFISLAFEAPDGADLRERVAEFFAHHAQTQEPLDEGQLIERFDAWLLPEVSYLPTVLRRFERLTHHIPGAMVGYDIMPMSQPANYRLIPGTDGYASEYFRLLATASSVVCISEHSRDEICTRLRRDVHLPISVAHPGGDHVAAATERVTSPDRSKVRFLRVGTLEDRKMPREIIAAFEHAVGQGMEAELIFVGRPSASDDSINEVMQRAVEADVGIRWIADATDADVQQWVRDSDLFLSFGVEGYGIPVLEALRLGTPVVFGGVQPAADLLRGRGCVEITDLTTEGLASAFTKYANPQEARALAESIEAASIPRWEEFTREVVRGVLRA